MATPPRKLFLSLCLLFLSSFLFQAQAKTAEVCEVQDKEVTDKQTGIKFPIHRSFPHAGKKDFALLGAGPRRKNLYVAQVNVYSVGLYLESSSLSKLKAYKGKDTQTLTKDKSYYQTLLKPGMGRALHLVFARSVGAEKVVEALSAIDGVKPELLADFSSTLLKAIWASIGKGETITLAWTSSDTLALSVRDKQVKVFPSSAALAKGIYNLYLGDKTISQEAKNGFAAVTPRHLQ